MNFNDTLDKKDELTVQQLYINTFGQYSYNNPLYAQISFHVIEGQLLRNILIPKGATKIDSRLNLFLLQPSGSGKTTAYRFIKEICEALGLRIMTLDEVSDPALIGTIENNYEFGESEYTSTTGILAEADIVHFDEASALIKKKEYTKSTLSYFQTALNPIGDPSNTIYKKLAHGPPIELQPHCSFILTSFPPAGIIKAVVETGFFQRIFTVPRRLTRDERKNNSFRDIDLIGTYIDTTSSINEIVKQLLKIKKYISENPDFYFPERVKPVLRNKISQYYKAINAPNQQISELLDTFVPRYQDHLYRLSVHSAALNFRNEVTPSDISYAFDIVFPIFKLLLSWLESDHSLTSAPTQEKKYLQIAIKVFRKMDKMKDEAWVSKSAFVKELIPYMSVSQTTVYSYINKFTEQGYISQKKDGRNTWICIPNALKKTVKEKIKDSSNLKSIF